MIGRAITQQKKHLHSNRAVLGSARSPHVLTMRFGFYASSAFHNKLAP